MFGVKVVAFLALAFVVAATDLEEGLAIMACARRAINGGVPELGIPTHDPFVVIKHNFSWHGNINPILSADFKVHDMTWAGLATWNLTASQDSKDSDKNAVFDFEFDWNRMVITGKFDLRENELFIHQEQHGDFSIGFKESTWKGKIDVTKPNGLNNGTVNDVQINWAVDDVETTIHGLGVLNTPVAFTIATTLRTALNNQLIGNTIGDFIKMRLSTIWWDTGKVWDLVQWCKDHPVSSTNF